MFFLYHVKNNMSRMFCSCDCCGNSNGWWLELSNKTLRSLLQKSIKIVWCDEFSMKPWGRYCRRALAGTLGSSLPSSGQCGDSQPSDFILILTNHFVKHSVHARFQMLIHDKIICNDAYLQVIKGENPLAKELAVVVVNTKPRSKWSLQ